MDPLPCFIVAAQLLAITQPGCSGLSKEMTGRKLLPWYVNWSVGDFRANYTLHPSAFFISLINSFPLSLSLSLPFYPLLSSFSLASLLLPPPPQTAALYPSIVFGMGFFLNFFIWGEHSSGAVPFTTMLALLCMWFGISFPLVFTGFYFGFRKQPYEHPVRTNQIPRQVPEQVWYLHPVLA